MVDWNLCFKLILILMILWHLRFHRDSFFRWCNCRGAMGLGHREQYPYKQIRNKNPFRLIDLIGWNHGFPKEISLQCQSGWWFGTFLFFPFIEKNNPNWPILFRGVGQPPTSNMLDYLELDSRSRHDLGLMAFSCPFSKAKARDPNDTHFFTEIGSNIGICWSYGGPQYPYATHGAGL